MNLITENHPLDSSKRKNLDLKSILIKQNVWIGAGAKILPGVSVGENLIVATGALVHRDISANILVGGMQANVIRAID